MKDILRIFEFEFLKEVKTKSYIITTLVLAALVIGTSFVIGLVVSSEMKNEEEKSRTVGIIKGPMEEEEIKKIFPDYALYGTDEEVNQAIEDEDIEYGLAFNSLDDVRVLVKRSGTDALSGAYIKPIKDYILDQRLADYDLSQAKIDEIYDGIEIKQDVVAIKEVNAMAIVGGFVSIILIYMMVLGSGQTVASAIAMEKQDRTMEILLSSTRPSALIHGKVFASLATAFIQIIVIGIAGAIGVFINMDKLIRGLGQAGPQGPGPAMDPGSISQLFENLNINFDPKILLLSLAFFITGYFLYVYIFAALGASVSKMEDLGVAIMPITMLTVVIYIASIMALQNPDGKIMEVLSFVPFSSVFIASIRYVLSDMSLAMLGLSYLILLVTTLIFVKLSVRLYRMTSLNYGNTTLRSQIKALFAKG